MSKTTMKIIGWVVSIVVAIIGTFGATTAITNKNNNNNSNKNDNKQTQNQTQEQKQEQNISITINGEQVEINKDNAQEVYGVLEKENKEIKESLVKGLEITVNKDYDAKKVSLFAFEPVNDNRWEKNQGSTKDSLGNVYETTLPYVVMGDGSYGEYYVNKEFKELKFSIAPNEEMDQYAATVKVTTDDGISVKTISDISRKTEMQTYSIDLTGAKFVKIECSGSYAKVMLLDATLIK